MVKSGTEADSSKKLLRAEKLDEIAGEALRRCESCGVEQVPVGPCFIRDQALSGFSNPNTRICIYAARRPLNADVYPPFDQSPEYALGTQLDFVPRSENNTQEAYKNLRDINLKEDNVREVSEKFEKNQVVVLKAPTGFGKSTKLPYWLCWHEVSKFSNNSGKVIVTEPKRMAAEGVARIVSMAHQNRGPAPGLDVGLQHGEVSSSGESNKLMFVTDGSLINRLVKRELEDIQLIIVDEAHERNERIELILLLLRFLLPQYPHLKLLILSATIDPDNFTTYFQPREDDPRDAGRGAHLVPISASKIDDWEPKQIHEVEEFWSGGTFEGKFNLEEIKELVNKACEKASERPGHVLVFLPGEPQIKKLQQAIERFPRFEIQGLTGKTSQEERERIQERKASEKNLIILATNVAESSVTFTDLVCVVDSGLRKRSKNDDLEIVEITQAEQRQRRGRVGRDRAGFYFAAFSKESKEKFKEYPDSSLVDLSDYHREVMLLQAMSVGIDPTILEDPRSYLMKPDELTDPTKRVLNQIRKRGGLAGERNDEYLTPVGLLAAQVGISVELAQLLLISDHHNVLTEMSAVVANMVSRREDKHLTRVDVTNLLHDHKDSVSPSKLQDDLVHDIVHKFQQLLRLPKFQRILKVLFTSLLRLFFGQPDEDQAVDDDSVASDLRVRRDVVGDLRDSYLLQSFDKLEENKFSIAAALISKQGLKDAREAARLRLETTNRIQQQFQERVPEDRLREIDPRLFERVKLAVECWRTKGWCFELSLIADANQLYIGSKQILKNNMVKKSKNQVQKSKEDIPPDSATMREKNLQKLWELEGRLTRTHGSEADPVILQLARSLLKEKRECRVVSDDHYEDWYTKKFSDLKDTDQERRCSANSVSRQLEQYLAKGSQHQHSGRTPLEVIVDMSNIIRITRKKYWDSAELSRIVKLMDDLGSVAEESNGLHRDPRNSLILNLGKHGDHFEGEVNDITREALVPEMTMPVGSRWMRVEGTNQFKRDLDSEDRFIKALSGNEAYSLLPRAVDDLASESTREVDVRSVLIGDLTDKCFFVDMLKKQYLKTPAKQAQGIRQRNENERKDLELNTNVECFQVRRVPGSNKLENIPSYLESDVIQIMKNASLQDAQFIVHREPHEPYVTGKWDEVKVVKVKLKIQRNGRDFYPIVKLGAWQVCPWWSAVPDSKERFGQEMKSSRLPEVLLEFGDHRMKIVHLARRDHLLCTMYDKSKARKTFIKRIGNCEKETLEVQRECIAGAARKFKEDHRNRWYIERDRQPKKKRLPTLTLALRLKKSTFAYYRFATHYLVNALGSRSITSPRKTIFSRRWIWVTLIGIGVIALWMQFSSFRESNDYSDFVPDAPVTQAPATTVFSPRTADDWFVALNCVEDPSERDIGRVATAIFVCYSESNPEEHSISIFQYDNLPGESEVKRRVKRACGKRDPTGEVFALIWPGQPSFFVYTIYADAVARSRAPDLFERLSC